MKNIHPSCPGADLMKLSPELDINPSRPYPIQAYTPEFSEVTNDENYTFTKINFKIKVSSVK